MSKNTPPSEAPDLATILGLPVDAARLEEVAHAFEEIRAAIEALRAYDIGEPHPAIVFRPIVFRPIGERP